MLQLKPTCENCNSALPPNSTEAMICSYECTFCQTCVDTVLENVCPNCGGGFCPRPVRPKKAWRNGVSLRHQPASDKDIHKPVDLATHQAYAAKIKGILPKDR